MADPVLAQVRANPKYQALVTRRTRFGWSLTIAVLVVYFGYIGLIAFDKPLLARPIGTGSTTLGMPVGFGVLVFTIAITALYVWRANREFDRLTREIVEEAGR